MINEKKSHLKVWTHFKVLFYLTAAGEPSLCSGVCVLLALRQAIAAARADAGNTEWFQLGKIKPTTQ
jgi:hypothetical protein